MKRLLFISSIFFIFLSVPIFRAGATAPIKILLVPGHDDEVWGAQYGNLKEAPMNLALATQIYNILKKDKRFQVYITRDSDGYTKEFQNYFDNHRDEISAFKENAKTAMQEKINGGSFVQKVNPPHHATSEDVAIKLYGLNKWADENKIDAMIHVHFDDYTRKTIWTMGKYKGFTIYMPEDQMANSAGSVKLAGAIFMQLKKKYATSNYPAEVGGLIPDQKLIALGSNGTLISSVRSVLIEYGYIYRFGNSVMRHKAYTSMANLTATGIKNYFFPK